MYEILEKRSLNPTVTLMRIHAPAVAKKAEPGQFIILRTDAEGERIPLTVADFDRTAGSVTVIFQIVGATTERLSHLSAGDCLQDFVGPLGRATETAGKKRVAVVVGGVGCAIGYPVAKKFHDLAPRFTPLRASAQRIWSSWRTNFPPFPTGSCGCRTTARGGRRGW